jgi:hypothetical protein
MNYPYNAGNGKNYTLTPWHWGQLQPEKVLLSVWESVWAIKGLRLEFVEFIQYWLNSPDIWFRLTEGVNNFWGSTDVELGLGMNWAIKRGDCWEPSNACAIATTEASKRENVKVRIRGSFRSFIMEITIATGLLIVFFSQDSFSRGSVETTQKLNFWSLYSSSIQANKLICLNWITSHLIFVDSDYKGSISKWFDSIGLLKVPPNFGVCCVAVC